ncbi:MAG: hypothetical protein WD794_09560 [Mycobacteriales bacterium]
MSTSYGAPRTLLYVTIKRDNTSWRSIYGHWWVEVDGRESYGWWPASVPLGVRQLVRGTDGILNGLGLLGLRGTWYRDPNHGQSAVHAFHPVLSIVKTDDEVREDVRSFAHGYRAPWRWHWTSARASGTCRAFQDELLASVGLREGPEQLHTRGSGCPFLYPFRATGWRLADALDDLTARAAPAEAQRPLCPPATRGSCSSAG